VPGQPYTEAVIIDDKGVFYTTAEGMPIEGGAKVIFRSDTVHYSDGSESTTWFSASSGGLEWRFNCLADMRAFCRENGLKFGTGR
jgi:hypothetical protein